MWCVHPVVTERFCFETIFWNLDIGDKNVILTEKTNEIENAYMLDHHSMHSESENETSRSG